MRFTHSLTFNSVPEWRENYLSYASHKKALHSLERARFEVRRLEDAKLAAKERSEAFNHEDELRGARTSVTEAEGTLASELVADIRRVATFYVEKRQAFEQELQSMKQDRRPSSRQPLQTLYQNAHDLSDYREMNWNGFNRLIVRLERLRGGQPIGQLREALKPLEATGTLAESCENLWSSLYGSQALGELKDSVRERLAFERASVWQELVQAERKAAAIEPATRKSAAAHHGPGPIKQAVSIILAILSLSLILLFPVFQDGATNRCAAMVSCLIILWCSEALPLYATSMLLPALAVVMRVQKDKEGNVLEAKKASDTIFHEFFSDKIMLLIGGFAMAAALSRFGVTKTIAQAVLRRSSKKPKMIILVNMALCTFASIFIGNIAASVLSFGLLQPILRQLPYGHELAKALILSIAYAGNVGGLISPISSPQNIVCQGVLKDKPIGFLQWMAAAIPTGIASTLTTWFVLITVFKVGTTDIVLQEVDRQVDAKTRRRQYFVSAVSIVGIVLFCFLKQLTDYVGSMGVLAIIPTVIYFGANCLGKEDFNGFLWNVVMLAMGGSALGACVTSSGLLKAIGDSVSAGISGMHPYAILAIFGLFITVVTSFISHTVGSMILLPLIAAIGESMTGIDPQTVRIFVFAGCFGTSSGMGLPISGFPNMSAVAQEDAQGRPYVNTNDFMKTGIYASALMYLVILGVSVPLMYLIKV